MIMTSFPGLREHDDRMAAIAKDYWRPFESFEEHAGRVSRCMKSALWYFDEATKPQRKAHRRAMEDLRGLSAPRYDRAREAADRDWHASTARARDLLEITFSDLMRDGEVAEETSYLWDALEAETLQSEAA